MKNTKKLYRLLTILYILILPFYIVLFHSCESNDIKGDKHKETFPPDFNKVSGIDSFQPDSGNIATQLIIKGFNLGTDTSYVKVTVNDKKARVIGIFNDYVYAVVPARADTGLVKLHIGKGEEVKVYESSKEFIYLFTRNVTTYAGLYDKQYENEKDAIDGLLTEARFRRPWVVKSDKDGALYVIDEGRGTQKNGALRKIYNGVVETILQNSTGPFQSPADLAFSRNEDTIFVANMHGGGVETDACVIYGTRDAGFMNMKNLVLAPQFQTTTVAVNPITGDVFFNNAKDGYIYKYLKEGGGQANYEKVHQINNNNNINCRMIFNPEGTELIIAMREKHVIFKAQYNISTRTLSEPKLFVGQWGEADYVDGIGAQAKLNVPVACAFDDEGNLFVTERHNHCIRKITPKGETSKWAGMIKEWGHKDGLPDVVKFRDPEGITITPDGIMFVAEQGGQIIRKVVVE